MRFAVVASLRNTIEQYEEKLNKFGLIKKEIKNLDCLFDDEVCEVYYVEINTLEELLELKTEVGHRIILRDDFYDGAFNWYQEPTIEIYNGYRE